MDDPLRWQQWARRGDSHHWERLCSTVKSVIVEDIHYCGGDSVLWRIFSNMEDFKYFGGCSVLWGIPLVLWWVFSAVEDVQYCGGYHEFFGGLPSEDRGVFSSEGDIISIAGRIPFSTVEGYYWVLCWECSVLWRENTSNLGIIYIVTLFLLTDFFTFSTVAHYCF